MGKISERFILYMKNLYIRRGDEWTRFDDLLWTFWTKFFGLLILIPAIFWISKLFIIDYLLKKKGFETMVGYSIIILLLKPMFFDALHKILEFKNELKKP